MLSPAVLGSSMLNAKGGERQKISHWQIQQQFSSPSLFESAPAHLASLVVTGIIRSQGCSN